MNPYFLFIKRRTRTAKQFYVSRQQLLAVALYKAEKLAAIFSVLSDLQLLSAVRKSPQQTLIRTATRERKRNEILRREEEIKFIFQRVFEILPGFFKNIAKFVMENQLPTTDILDLESMTEDAMDSSPVGPAILAFKDADPNNHRFDDEEYMGPTDFGIQVPITNTCDNDCQTGQIDDVQGLRFPEETSPNANEVHAAAGSVHSGNFVNSVSSVVDGTLSSVNFESNAEVMESLDLEAVESTINDANVPRNLEEPVCPEWPFSSIWIRGSRNPDVPNSTNSERAVEIMECSDLEGAEKTMSGMNTNIPIHQEWPFSSIWNQDDGIENTIGRAYLL